MKKVILIQHEFYYIISGWKRCPSTCLYKYKVKHKSFFKHYILMTSMLPI
jgi:hypothetical protein